MDRETRDKKGHAQEVEISNCSEPKNQQCKYQELKSSNSEHTCTFIASPPSALQEVVTLDSSMSDQRLVATGINPCTNNSSPLKKLCSGVNSVETADLVRSSDLAAKQERPAVILLKTNNCVKSPDFNAEQKMPSKQQVRYTCRYSSIDDTFMKKQNISRSSDLSEKELPVCSLPLNPVKGTSGQNFATVTSFHKKPHLSLSNISDFSSHKINSPRSSVNFIAKSCVSSSTLECLKLHLSKHFVHKQSLPACNINITDQDAANSFQEDSSLKVTSTEKPYISRASGISQKKAPFCSQTVNSLNGASHNMSTVTHPVLRGPCAKTSMPKSSLPLSRPHNHTKDARVHGRFWRPSLNNSSGLELANTVAHKEFNVHTSQVLVSTGVNTMQKSNLGSSLDSIPVCQKQTPETVPMIPCLGCRSTAGISHTVKRGLCFKLNEASKSLQTIPLSNTLSVQQGKQKNCNGQQFSGIDTLLSPSIGSVNFATGVFAQDCESYISNGKQDLLKLPLVSAQKIHKSSSIKDTSVNLEGIPTSDCKRKSIPSLKDTVSKLQKKLDDLISKSTSKGNTGHSSLISQCSKGLCASSSTRSNPEEKETLLDKSEDNISTPVLLPQGKDKEFIWLTGLDVVVDSLLQMNS